MPIDLRIDDHKLTFHPHRVAEWLDGKEVYPLYMEISPSGTCNHRCTFCAKDYLEYRQRFINTDFLVERLPELAALGLRSIMYAGEGEPLLHRDIAKIINRTYSAGIDVALTTNGVFLVPELSEHILSRMSWVKISIDAGSPAGYAAIHRADPNDFLKVFTNIEAAARLIESNKWGCTLGTQAILLPENVTEMEALAARVKSSGASYLVIKPYSQHLKSKTCRYAGIDYSPFLEVQERLEGFNDDSFKVFFRLNTFMKSKRKVRNYGSCLALPFWSYIDADGEVWGCSSFLGDDRFSYGNIYTDSFQSVWTGDRRRNSLDFVAGKLDVEDCRINCRMDSINHYLWELTHPSEHINFI